MGGGYGWKTLENLAQELEIPIQDIIEFLKSEGIDAKKKQGHPEYRRKKRLEGL